MTVRVVHTVEGHPLATSWETIVPATEQTEENLEKIGRGLLGQYGLHDAEVEFRCGFEVTFRIGDHGYWFLWA